MPFPVCAELFLAEAVPLTLSLRFRLRFDSFCMSFPLLIPLELSPLFTYPSNDSFNFEVMVHRPLSSRMYCYSGPSKILNIILSSIGLFPSEKRFGVHLSRLDRNLQRVLRIRIGKHVLASQSGIWAAASLNYGNSSSSNLFIDVLQR